ncbi:uncharacterized protein LOC135489527 isoform X2 [Lineus longissimus]|uniref:uncharacterized protein LOC135489527 isoform X2 n=1 Tax=Lineus longissimus TaxID=88925 RepID=UPI00315D252E
MSADRDTQFMDAKSLATKYETIMTEKGGRDAKPTEERMALIFHLLDNMVPHMGIFRQTVSLMMKEIYEAVYSDQLTTDIGKKVNKKAPVQRIPYLTLVKQVYDKRDERAEEMQEQIEVLKQKLYDKHVQFEDSVETITNLRNDIDQLKSTVESLEDDIQNLENTVEYQERTMDEERDRADTIQNNLEADIADLKDDLNNAKNEIKYLYKFKDGYDELQDAFTVKEIDAIPTKKKKKEKLPVVATRRAHLFSNIESACKLEEQLLMVQNTTIEEFDDYLEKHKEELISKHVPDGQSQEDFEKQEDEIEKVDQELQVKQTRFKKSIDELNTELELIKQHKTMLEEQLQILEENKPAVAAKKKKGGKGGKSGPTDPSKESLLTEGLDVDEEEAQPDPFIPQERVFSKYAAMMYTSTNQGKTFHEFKDAKYCPSCGEKTLICPHRVRGAEIAFPLPHNCTHLKITRPKVKINQQMMDTFFKPFTATTLQTPTTADRKSTGKHRQFEGFDGIPDRELEGIGEGESLPDTPSFLRESPSMGIEAHMKYPLNRIWDDYATRTLLRRVIPRPLTVRRTLSITEQFYAYMLWQDEYGLEDDGYQSILDNMYSFLRERYLKEDVVFLSAYDLITALLEYAPTNRTVQILANILTGNLDASTFRYILLLSDFITQVQWRDVEDFRNFSSVVYPFCTEDDLETLHMGFVSFSENKVSAELVYEYILYIILKYREPRFLDCEAKLITHPANEPGQMTYKEFSDALDNILSVSNDKLRKRLYYETDCLVIQFDETEEAVPIQKLSQMTSYLSLLQISPVVKESVAEKVAFARDMMMMNAPMTNMISKAMSGYSQSPAGSDRHPIFTMENIKNLAANIARLPSYWKVGCQMLCSCGL